MIDERVSVPRGGTYPDLDARLLTGDEGGSSAGDDLARPCVRDDGTAGNTREVTVPLSEHEQQLLEQMEQALYAEDPKFASQMQGAGARAAARRRVIIGVVGVLLGLALVFGGILWTMWIGAAGFAVIVAAVVFAVTPPRRGGAKLGAVQADGTVRRPTPAAKTRKAGSRSGATFMQRLEHRWDRRRDQY